MAFSFLPKGRSGAGRGCETPGPRYSAAPACILGEVIPPMLSPPPWQMPVVQRRACGGSAAPISA